MKIAIIYRSILGTTKKYAWWLQEELQCDIFRFQDVKKSSLKKYDLLVLSSGTYIGYSPLTNFLRRHLQTLQNKKVVIITVGVLPEDNPNSQKAYRSIVSLFKQKIKYFKLPGKLFSYSPLGKVKKENLKKVVGYIKKTS